MKVFPNLQEYNQFHIFMTMSKTTILAQICLYVVNFLLVLLFYGLVVKALDSQSRGPVFKTTGWFQGRLSLSSFQGR